MKHSRISNIFFVAFGFMLCWLLVGQCEPAPKEKIKTVYQDKIVRVPEIDTVIQTNTITEIEKDPYLVRDTILDTITQYIADHTSKELLAEIARNHYKINLYIDSIQIDSLGFLLVKDSIQSNRIKSRSIEYNLSFDPPDQRKSFLSAGVSAGGNKDQFDLGIGVMFTTKARWSFGYDYYALGGGHMVTVKKSIFNFK